ncbi:hypothetical protein LAV79_06860 [Peribacillus butanolivorans]|uniref:hypothetical protein n=1 Tax=Peribacillus butanolivorans TaxID=421767 RepID=UPI0030C9E718
MSHSWKRTISYLSYLILLLSVLFFGLKYQHHLEIISSETFEIKGYFLFQSFFPIFIGIILAIPSIVQNFLTNGHWKVNWLRLLILRLPFIYMSIIPILYFTEIIKFDLPFSTLVWVRYFGADGSIIFNSITGIIASYIVLTSIRKPADIQ